MLSESRSTIGSQQRVLRGRGRRIDVAHHGAHREPGRERRLAEAARGRELALHELLRRRYAICRSRNALVALSLRDAAAGPRAPLGSTSCTPTPNCGSSMRCTVDARLRHRTRPCRRARHRARRRRRPCPSRCRRRCPCRSGTCARSCRWTVDDAGEHAVVVGDVGQVGEVLQRLGVGRPPPGSRRSALFSPRVLPPQLLVLGLQLVGPARGCRRSR